MKYYLLTNTEFTCRQNPNDNSLRYSNNADCASNYPVIGPYDDLTFEGLKAWKLRVKYSCGTVYDPLDRCINCVEQDLKFYFDHRFGQRYQSDEDIVKEDGEKIEEDNDKEKDEKIDEEIKLKETAG